MLYNGYVFFCDKSNQQECLLRKQYLCVSRKNKSGKIKAGSVIFIYNTEDKSLLGPFTTLTEGTDELDAGAWMMTVEEEMPSENFKVVWEDLHILENAPAQLPFLSDPDTCALSQTQTQRILDLLRLSPLYLFSKEHTAQS